MQHHSITLPAIPETLGEAMPNTTIRLPEASIPQQNRAPREEQIVVNVDGPAEVAIADPGPLGLAAFAMTTFILSLFNGNLIGDAKLEAVVLPVALVYGGIGQLLAGMWEFRKGNTFGALAFSSYGAFWISFVGYVKLVAPGLPAADAHTATGIFLLSWTIFTAYMLLASLKTNAVLAAVFGCLLVTFALLTLGAFNPTHAGLTHVGGYFGLATAALGWYLSAAVVTNATWKRQVLPTFPIGG